VAIEAEGSGRSRAAKISGVDLGIEGRVALVTGGSQGIGRAIAAELVAEGARVAIASRTRERVDEAAREIGAKPFVHDATDPDHAPVLVDEVVAALGPVEILVTNTGGPPAGPDPLDFLREDWERAYRTLILDPLELVKATLPGMRERGFGRIVNIASTTVREPAAALMLSNTHRAGVLAALKTISREVASDGVSVNSVLPGRIATERLFSLYGGQENAQEHGAADVPAGRLGTVEEMAAAAAFLCSARASYITGVALLVDGGLTRAI
jgi:3-oxoacyl-[acyl-carrier protein] reductase